MSNCTLCDLVAHTIPVSVAYEYSTIFAFMDIKPVNYGHVVIVPKKHVVYMAELDEDAGAELFKVTMRVAQAVRRLDIKCEAVNLFLADGEAAGQEQFHVHMHVIPRFKDDRFTLQIDYPTRPTREDLDKTAERIRLLTSWIGVTEQLKVSPMSTHDWTNVRVFTGERLIPVSFAEYVDVINEYEITAMVPEGHWWR